MAQHPARTPLDEQAGIEQQVDLDLDVDQPVERLRPAQKDSMSNTSRATRCAATTSGAPAPVSSVRRNANEIPARLTVVFARTVARISRRSGWRSIASAKRSRTAAGEVRVQGPSGVRALVEV